MNTLQNHDIAEYRYAAPPSVNPPSRRYPLMRRSPRRPFTIRYIAKTMSYLRALWHALRCYVERAIRAAAAMQMRESCGGMAQRRSARCAEQHPGARRCRRRYGAQREVLRGAGAAAQARRCR